jgi:hypothetical protein
LVHANGFQLTQNYKLSESKRLSFSATFTNLFNQHAVTAYNEQNRSLDQFATYLSPGGLPFYVGGPAYTLYEHLRLEVAAQPDQVTLNSQYGKPYLYQLAWGTSDWGFGSRSNWAVLTAAVNLPGGFAQAESPVFFSSLFLTQTR